MKENYLGFIAGLVRSNQAEKVLGSIERIPLTSDRTPR
jgi:hypothetical protein